MMRIVALALALSGASVATAQSASARIAEGRSAYESLDYETSVAALEEALSMSSIGPLDRARALETLSFALAVLNREREAEDRLEELFALDPYYVVREPTGSPRVEALVARVRERVVPDAALVEGLDVRLELPRRGRHDSPVAVRVRVGGARRSAVDSVRVRYRGETETDWSTLEADIADASAGERAYDALIPALGRADRLELYAEARDGRGRLLARSAGPLAPSFLEVELATSSGGGENVLETWWFWTIVGVVVVGAGVGVGVGVASMPSGVPDGTLPPGRVVLP